jgi:hypothetical protein
MDNSFSRNTKSPVAGRVKVKKEKSNPERFVPAGTYRQ